MKDSSDYTEDLQKALKVLKEGGIILYPTDTIWGIGCDALNREAVDRIYKLKQREDSKSMLVLLDDAGKLFRYVQEVPDIAMDLVEVSDKPITVIYPGAKNLASILIAEDGSIGIRISTDQFNKDLISRLGKAIVSTSANITGKPAPQIFDEIEEEITTAVDYIVDYRRDDLSRKDPSSIIKIWPGGEFKIIRK
jgi:L-threonylcarbamoyladenylate synthase